MVLAQLLLWLVSGDSLVVACPSGGTVVFVFQWWYLVVVRPNRVFPSSARPGEELLRAIRRSGTVFDALSTRGHREEWGKRRAMLGLRWFPDPEKAVVPAVATRSRQANPSRQELLSRHIVVSRSEGGRSLCRDSNRRS
ncbi:hypothetical protein Taro_046401 [Colocasia esculenta]|uniref:Secreted protein n=1 Tax=Colocasia esculenta TaxID=4460 RepID=A0A843WZ41_COLES|nr:hypothetical protein [Colocasia esculenta]